MINKPYAPPLVASNRRAQVGAKAERRMAGIRIEVRTEDVGIVGVVVGMRRGPE